MNKTWPFIWLLAAAIPIFFLKREWKPIVQPNGGSEGKALALRSNRIQKLNLAGLPQRQVDLKPAVSEQVSATLSAFSRYSRAPLLSKKDNSEYAAILASPAVLNDVKELLSMGPIAEDGRRELLSQEAAILDHLSGISISRGQTLRVQAVRLIKKSFTQEMFDFDYYQYVMAILFAPNLLSEEDLDARLSV